MGTVASYHFHANTLVVCNNHGYHRNCQTPYSEEAFDFKRKFQQYRQQQQRQLSRRQKLSSSSSARGSRIDSTTPVTPTTAPAQPLTISMKRQATTASSTTKRGGGIPRPATVGATNFGSRSAMTHCCFNSFFDPACGAWAPAAAQTVFPRSYKNKLQILVFGRDEAGGGGFLSGNTQRSRSADYAAGRDKKPPLRPLTAMRSEKNRDQFALPGVMRSDDA